jgi:DNA-binding NtrC family response regulator
MGKLIQSIPADTMSALMSYDWPGNVRELQNVIYSAALDCEGQWIRPLDIPALSPAPVPQTFVSIPAEDDPNLDRAILHHINLVLTRVDGNNLRAARMLGISRSTLYRLLDAAVPTPSA